jgi:septal ring factor EnvC (AmiA/AmiB activator)
LGRLLLSTSGVRRLGQAARTAAALSKLDRDRVTAHRRTLEELTASRARLDERGRRLAALRVEARNASAEVARAAQPRSDAIEDIDRQRDHNPQLAGELQAAQQKLQAALATMASGSAAVETIALPLRPFQGDLAWPLRGAIAQRFGRERTRFGTEVAKNGIEIASPEGTPVAAIHEGSVAFADAFTGFGHLVILDHGGQAFSLYGYLGAVDVARGARIERGQPLGQVGSSPTGPTGLYFELRIDGKPVDPLQWLGK